MLLDIVVLEVVAVVVVVVLVVLVALIVLVVPVVLVVLRRARDACLLALRPTTSPVDFHRCFYLRGLSMGLISSPPQTPGELPGTSLGLDTSSCWQ